MKVKTLFLGAIVAFILTGLAMAQETPLCTAAYRSAIDGIARACRDQDGLCDPTGNSLPIDAETTLALSFEDGVYPLRQWAPRADLIDGRLTMIAFGAITVTNQGQPNADFIALPVRVSTRTGLNLRAEPREDASVMESLEWGYTGRGIGRNADASWILIEGRTGLGWAKAELLSAEFEWMLLAETDRVEGPLYGTWQRLTLISADSDNPESCFGTPPDGLLIQSPALATIVINDHRITFDGTIYAQSTSDPLTTISILEGEATLNDDQRLEVGQQWAIEIMPNAEPYVYLSLRYAALDLLPRPIELPFNTVGLLIPFEPGTGFLTRMQLSDPCRVAWSSAVNLRAGPGTTYPLLQGVAGGNSADPDGRAIGFDGRIWWRLTEGVWVLAESTVFGGNCAELPYVEVPPLATPSP
ncbi:MAG: hypothetical protein MUF87_14865 [Anaerolineae bacterium]|nr:hypothetical protein [Anaerolineae bacterium]